MKGSPHFVFAGGGSLGNVYPGLSIAERLIARLPTARVTFVGDGRAIERQTVHAAGHEYRVVPCKPRPRKTVDAVRFVTDNTLGLIASRWLLRETRASLVVGLGGHATAPLLRAGLSCGLPTVMLEQNATPSHTSRWLAARADAICLGFEEARPRLPIAARTRVTGTPVRPAFYGARRSRRTGLAEDRRLVIIGGVAGAQSLNHAAAPALARLRDSLRGWSVVHQAGEGQLVETERRYRQAGVDAVVVAYIDEMADLLRETDLVVCRSGGCTLAELALAGVPAIVTPDSRDAELRQFENARIIERAGGCLVLDERRHGLTAALADAVGAFVSDETLRRRAAEAIAATARPDAAELVAEACCEALGEVREERRIVAAAA